MNNIKKHTQVCIKTNSFVDAGMVDILTTLSSVPELITIESCEGYKEWGFVYFWYGDWEKVCRFMFKKLAPALNKELGGENISLKVRMYGSDVPQGEIGFRVESRQKLADTLKKILTEIK